MSCCGPAGRDFIPLCGIHAVLNRLFCALCNCTRPKERKYEDYKCAVRQLSRYSIDPRGGYAAFIGVRDNDPTHFLALYIDNLRGEYDPNIQAFRIYHVAFVMYGDMNSICRVLRQRHLVIAGNAAEFTGESPIEGAVSQKVFRSQPNNVQPIGYTMPFAGNPEIFVQGTPEDINRFNEFAVGANS
jgi:hypothetical protein